MILGFVRSDIDHPDCIATYLWSIKESKQGYHALVRKIRPKVLDAKASPLKVEIWPGTDSSKP